MAQTIKIEQRTHDFNRIIRLLKAWNKLPPNAELARVIDVRNVSTISEIKAFRQNIQPDSWEKFKEAFKNEISELSDLSENSGNTLEEDQPEIETYQTKRRNHKTNKQETLMYYEIGANAATRHTAEILPVKKEEGVLHISDLFKGSEYAIRVSGNSMTPNYPSGAIIGIREIHDKQITPGSVYVIEKENDLWLKRLFYKDDNQDSGFFECASDNNMRYENGTRVGKLYYPSFEIAIDKVRKLFKVTGIYKPNELSVIN